MIRKYLLLNILSKMLSSPLYAMLTLSKTTSSNKNYSIMIALLCIYA